MLKWQRIRFSVFFFTSQADRLMKFERRGLPALGSRDRRVSEDDASSLRELCGISNISTIPTRRRTFPISPARPLSFPHRVTGGLVFFAGSMDWMPKHRGRALVHAARSCCRSSTTVFRIAR